MIFLQVFDLAENKHEPMCDQKVVRKSKLTHVRFNQREPLLLIGDDRGGVLCLKVSNCCSTASVRVHLYIYIYMDRGLHDGSKCTSAVSRPANLCQKSHNCLLEFNLTF